MKLTDEQLDSFNKNGFLILRNFANPAQCEAILDIALAHLKHKIEPLETEIGYGKKTREYRTEVSNYNSLETEAEVTVRRLRQVYHRDVLFKQWMEDSKIRPILQQVLDDQVVITTAHHNSIMTKMPHTSTETSWHQDRRYWRFSDDNLVSVWLALDDENSENGVLEFVPSSHLIDFESNQFDKKEYFKTDDPRNMSLIETKVSTTLQKGDIVLFHCRLLHRANANHTEKAKISFVYTVKGASTKAVEGTRSSEYPEISLDYT
ncbi:MAG: phytanoyl-CoA dioxygenase family protein [Epsilonproteobacteria bacterium]|nr:phytanoyl-CoA dioxygenase family protein [Campylobacterota bacterium]